MRYTDKCSALAAGKCRIHVLQRAQVMGMWIYREDIYIDGHSKLVPDDKVFRTGGNVQQPVALQLDKHREAGWPSISEVNSGAGPDLFRFARGLQMSVEHQNVPGIE